MVLFPPLKLCMLYQADETPMSKALLTCWRYQQPSGQTHKSERSALLSLHRSICPLLPQVQKHFVIKQEALGHLDCPRSSWELALLKHTSSQNRYHSLSTNFSQPGGFPRPLEEGHELTTAGQKVVTIYYSWSSIASKSALCEALAHIWVTSNTAVKLIRFTHWRKLHLAWLGSKACFNPKDTEVSWDHCKSPNWQLSLFLHH